VQIFPGKDYVLIICVVKFTTNISDLQQIVQIVHGFTAPGTRNAPSELLFIENRFVFEIFINFAP